MFIIKFERLIWEISWSMVPLLMTSFSEISCAFINVNEISLPLLTAYLLWIIANSRPKEFAIMTDLLAPPSSGETTIQSFQLGMFCLIQEQNSDSTCSQRKCYKDVTEINIPSKNPLDDRKILLAVVNEDPSSSNGLPRLSSACLPPAWQWWGSGEMTSDHPGMRWC